MKIYHFYLLPRHPAIHHESFGFSTLVDVSWPPTTQFREITMGYNPFDSRTHDDYLEIGMALGSPGGQSIHPALYKSVECGESYMPFGGPRRTIVAERLFYRDANGEFVPYRIRYRVRGMSASESYLYHNNMRRIHRELSGVHPKAADPIQRYIGALLDMGNDYLTDSLWEVNAMLESHSVASNFSRECYDGHDVGRQLDRIGFQISNRQPLTVVDLGVPIIPKGDTLTRQWDQGPISHGKLHDYSDRGLLNDYPLPAAIEITHPEVTAYTPESLRDVVGDLDKISATDLDLEYILQSGTCVLSVVHHAIDRYAWLAPSNLSDRMLCDALIEKIRFWLVRLLSKEPTHQLGEYDEIKVRIRKTFNDEAYVSFTPRCSSDPLLAVHFDLAMLALCGHGVSFY